MACRNASLHNSLRKAGLTHRPFFSNLSPCLCDAALYDFLRSDEENKRMENNWTT